MKAGPDWPLGNPNGLNGAGSPRSCGSSLGSKHFFHLVKGKGIKQVFNSYIAAVIPPRAGTEHHSTITTIIACKFEGREVRAVIIKRMIGPWVVISKRVDW